MHSQRNKFDKKDSLEIGVIAEKEFEKIALTKGWTVSNSNKDKNINEHWDYLIKKGEKEYRVEVKARKRIRRDDPSAQDNWIWVELHGVRGKDEGWLYAGKADLIAFETGNSFVFVKREDLIDLVNKLVNFKSKVKRPENARYKVYSRPGRPDLLTLIELEKLRNLTYAEWQKKNH